MISTHTSCDHNAYHRRFRDTWSQRAKEVTRPFAFQAKAPEMAKNQYKSELLIRSHPRGRGFESHQVHHKSTVILIELRWIFLLLLSDVPVGTAVFTERKWRSLRPASWCRSPQPGKYRRILRQPNRRRRCVIGRTASGGYFFANLIRQRSDCCPTSSCGPPADPRRCPGYTDDAPPAYPASSAPDTPPGCPTGAAGGPYR